MSDRECPHGFSDERWCVSCKHRLTPRQAQAFEDEVLGVAGVGDDEEVEDPWTTATFGR